MSARSCCIVAQARRDRIRALATDECGRMSRDNNASVAPDRGAAATGSRAFRRRCQTRDAAARHRAVVRAWRKPTSASRVSASTAEPSTHGQLRAELIGQRRCQRANAGACWCAAGQDGVMRSSGSNSSASLGDPPGRRAGTISCGGTLDVVQRQQVERLERQRIGERTQHVERRRTMSARALPWPCPIVSAAIL